MSITTKPSTRRLELDWLRVLAIAAVFLFHSTRFFDRADWHVKNASRVAFLDNVAMVVIIWMMPLLFTISGASTFYALKRRSAGEFLRDQLLRLGVPLIPGILALGAWQVYLERLTHRQFSGSFWQFLPRYFQGRYGEGGNFAWMGLHLWYMLELLALSLILLPLFWWLKQGGGRKVLQWLGEQLARPGMVYLLGIPVMLLVAYLNPQSFLGARNCGGWSAVGYIPFFISGFLLVSHDRLYDSVQRWRWASLAAALGLTLLMLRWYLVGGEPRFGTARFTQLFAVYGLAAWCWVLMILGFAARHLTAAVPFLAVANEAVLPFYILHQPVLLTVGYLVVRQAMGNLAKWAIIAVLSLAICLGLYWFVIRPVNALRFLFGMKPLPPRRRS